MSNKRSAKWRKMLSDVGGYDNELAAVPASGVRKLIDEFDQLETELAAATARGETQSAPAAPASALPPEPQRYSILRSVGLTHMNHGDIIHYSDYDALRAAALELERDARILADIEKVLQCDYDVIAISLATNDWELGYEACERVVKTTIRDGRAK